MTATIFNTQTRTCQGFVYKWTYEPTGEYYIGIHKGNPDDGYVGSGTRFTKKFNNTPRSHWHREILFEGDYWNQCTTIERELVNKNTLTDPLCLNLAPGGGNVFYGSQHEKKKDSYRCKPQEVTLNGITYPTRMQAIQKLSISFEDLDNLLIDAGWQASCKYNQYNRY